MTITHIIENAGISDLEMYLWMLNRAGIEYKKEKYAPAQGPFFGVELEEVCVAQSERGFGYNDFYAAHYFNQVGALVGVGGWE